MPRLAAVKHLLSKYQLENTQLTTTLKAQLAYFNHVDSAFQ